jgi:hypothetical protein
LFDIDYISVYTLNTVFANDWRWWIGAIRNDEAGEKPMTETSFGAGEGRSHITVSTILAGMVWFAAILTLSLQGALEAEPDSPPVRLLVAASLPVLSFLGLYGASRAFRQWVQAFDLHLLVAMQSWRVLGGVFLVLMAYGILPGSFAWPAGLGDVAIGVAAPFVLLALLRDTGFARRKRFLVWNLLGLFDFVVAIGAGTLSSGMFQGLTGPISAAPVNAWPLNMIPGFLVPLFAMMHLAAIFQASKPA